MPFTTRLLAGGTAAFVATAACCALFGPYSDMSALELAAGPACADHAQPQRAEQSSPTGRGCASAEAERSANVVAPMRIARAGVVAVRAR
jgi:hypothetical protein